ncbi:hypothetical protein CDAR_227091 [Caerostris darwini]|uniref:Uncharacterized protein n=1 Tax=Caerostris darwini TaxID=1538125 RepID=A0AAV4PA25_9ARAC|nr:hypothetical protein CDAR_227091 [Caerostris darwini]
MLLSAKNSALRNGRRPSFQHFLSFVNPWTLRKGQRRMIWYRSRHWVRDRGMVTFFRNVGQGTQEFRSSHSSWTALLVGPAEGLKSPLAASVYIYRLEFSKLAMIH